MSTKEQSLVNAQTSVNRAVFEMNRPGLRDKRMRRKPSSEYVLDCIDSAMRDLEKARHGYSQVARRAKKPILAAGVARALAHAVKRGADLVRYEDGKYWIVGRNPSFEVDIRTIRALARRGYIRETGRTGHSVYHSWTVYELTPAGIEAAKSTGAAIPGDAGAVI